MGKLMQQEILEDQIIIIENDLIAKIKTMFSRGMSVLAIAAALALPVDVVQAATKQHTYSSIQNLEPLDILARTIYAEAEGESYKGKLAVASVIYIRAKKDINKMVDVVLKPKQFSCWNSGVPKEGQGQAWKDSLEIAQRLLSGNFKSIVNATHYYNPKIAFPKWARGRQAVAMIGRHRFMHIESLIG
jgi:spore germination cell wall hydrolase CwlJ-like protein